MNKALADTLSLIYGDIYPDDDKLYLLINEIDNVLSNNEYILSTESALAKHLFHVCRERYDIISELKEKPLTSNIAEENKTLNNSCNDIHSLVTHREPETNIDPSLLKTSARYSRLLEAIENNEFVLHYQPQISLSTGEIIGVEALIRWNHPEFGILSPANFIHLAEETGLIIPIGEWVLRTACQQIVNIRNAGIGDLRISVNVSALQFKQPNFVSTIEGIVRDTNINPHKLEIELTESYFIEDIDEAINRLQKIKQLGIALSIDDFGTGYSSLSYLTKLPVDTIKIDQSFIRDIPNNKDYESISKAIISIGHNLGLNVIAEGVETESQCKFLSKYLCDEIQGFYFSKGVSQNELSILLGNRKTLHSHLRHFTKNTKNLLLVDDEPANLKSLQRLFRSENYKISTAKDGLDALNILTHQPVDIIITDHKMPNMTGLELLKEVRIRYPHIIRITLTGQTETSEIIGAINEGAVYSFVTKPWNDENLKSLVKEAFKHKELEDNNLRLTQEMQIANKDMEALNRELKKLVNQNIPIPRENIK